MSDPVIARVVIESSGAISEDCPCRRCGYNLRGLHADRRCPECGTAVGLSVMGDLLRFADVDWLRRLIVGVRLIFVGIVAVFVLNEGCVGALLGARGGLINVLEGLASLILLGGAWRVTAADPSGLGEAQYGRVRKFIRGTLLLSAIAVVADTIPSVALIGGNGLSAVNEVLQIVSLLFGLAGTVAMFRYLAALAMRAPNLDVARTLRRVGWTLVALFALVIAISAIGFGLAFTQFGGAATVGGGGVTYSASAPASSSAPATGPASVTGVIRISSGGTTTVITNPAAQPALMAAMTIVAGLSLVALLVALFTLVGVVYALRRFQRCIAEQAESARLLTKSSEA